MLDIGYLFILSTFNIFKKMYVLIQIVITIISAMACLLFTILFKHLPINICLQVDIEINQYLHNEYRPSFITHHYKFCDLVNKDAFIGGAIRNAGVVCPLPAGYHGIMNITAPTEHFPNVFPFEKGRLDFVVSLTNTGEVICKLYVEVRFKQK
ncbi:uncharacterized protein LOC111352125 isoform X1 [Spodoptera litura]|uniref:Uncharacterized protein LOC111352125 isoform X1 n=1 Tax=Spodoptera litura TaxID=69820 RepID=A0A9J7DZK6_SPOLT|nr:uncharacterized protein LOC111352125 isoform X1 [Spodoptera litura]